MKIALTDRTMPIETKIPHLGLEQRSASPISKALLPIDPLLLQGLDQDGIDKLVPDFAQKGIAVDGGPKWSWMDAWGIRWEIRYHPFANMTFPSRPSGCGPTIRFGMQIVCGLHGNNTILSTDQNLIKKFGLPSQPAPANATQYVDKFGFVYFNIYGEIAGLYSDGGHIKGTGNFWQPAFAMSPTDYLKMPTDEITIYREFLDLLQSYNTTTSMHLVEAILVEWGKKVVEIDLANDPRWAGEAFWVAFNHLPSGKSRTRQVEIKSGLPEDEINRVAAFWANRLALSPSLQDSVSAIASAVREWIDTCDLSAFRQNHESDQQTIEKILWFWWCSLV
jgi:hypothetical protein